MVRDPSIVSPSLTGVFMGGGHNKHGRYRIEVHAAEAVSSPLRVPSVSQSVSQSYTPPSMEDGPTRTHTLHTIGSGADTRHAVTGRSTGSGLLDTQHTAHRTAHEVALYSGVLRDRHGRRRWSTGTGTQNSRTDIPPRAGGGGARERRGVWTRSLAGARPQIRRRSLESHPRSAPALRRDPARC